MLYISPSNNSKFNNQNINVGIELLRFILCLWVVIIHCAEIKKKHKKYFERGFHVPTFILIAFYFFYPVINNKNIIKIASRFQRLLCPYVLWPIIIFVINNLLNKYVSFLHYKKNLSIKDFFIQILTGAKYHVIFWFQFNLIFLSLFLTIIAFLFKENNLVAFRFIGIISLYLHFSKINLNLFISFHRRYKITIGTLIELIPLAIIGCNFSSINLLLKVKNFPLDYHFILLLLIHFLFQYNIFIFPSGFMYPNVFLNIVASTILFVSFGAINFFSCLINNSIILHITRFTGGIYYIHPIFRYYLQKYILYFQKKSYFSSYLIYIICYIFCFICCKLFKKNKLKYLFL